MKRLIISPQAKELLAAQECLRSVDLNVNEMCATKCRVLGTKEEFMVWAGIFILLTEELQSFHL
jgi:hypothetical protein